MISWIDALQAGVTRTSSGHSELRQRLLGALARGVAGTTAVFREILQLSGVESEPLVEPRVTFIV